MCSYESEWRGISRPVSLKNFITIASRRVWFLKSRSFCFCLPFLLLLIYFFVSLMFKVSFTFLFVSPIPLIWSTFCWGFCASPVYNFLSEFCIHLLRDKGINEKPKIVTRTIFSPIAKNTAFAMWLCVVAHKYMSYTLHVIIKICECASLKPSRTTKYSRG